jgi:hypothetical protein
MDQAALPPRFLSYLSDSVITLRWPSLHWRHRADLRFQRSRANKELMGIRAYHLTSVTHALSNIRHRRIKIATFDDLNDPFELWAVAQPNPVLRRALRCWKDEFARKYGVLCFSKTWANPVLWSHYADRHRGIALGFDINANMAKEVKYSRRRPPFYKADASTVQMLLYTKGLDWQYEKEVRIHARLEERDAATGLYFGDFSEHLVLREIITGPLCTTKKSEIEGALRDEGVSIIRGRLAFKTFRVVRNRVGLH